MQNNVAELLVRNSPPNESLSSLTIRVIHLNFASIHTTCIPFLFPLALYNNRSPIHSFSSSFLTQALFELACLPSSDIDSIRAEVTHALEEEGGWTKAALARFHKIDSLLKEVGRMYGVFERMSTFNALFSSSP
jgi:hypothetical protein